MRTSTNQTNRNWKVKVDKVEIKKQKAQVKKIIKLNKPHKKPVGEAIETLKENEVIKLRGVEKYLTNGYNYEYVLKGIDLTIYKGEFVVILGPSGSGKTTLLTLLSALDRPSNGDCLMFNKNTIYLKNSELTKLRANHIGYIFQQYGLLTDLTVEDNIKVALNITKNKSKDFNIDELLKSVDLLEHKNKKASNLSGGQSQRVAICRAIAKDPDILFGDEPTGAIHIDAAKQIMRIFMDINQKKKTTIIIVTHNDAITALADRIIKIESGKIKENYINKNKKTVDEINWEMVENNNN